VESGSLLSLSTGQLVGRRLDGHPVRPQAGGTKAAAGCRTPNTVDLIWQHAGDRTDCIIPILSSNPSMAFRHSSG